MSKVIVAIVVVGQIVFDLSMLPIVVSTLRFSRACSRVYERDGITGTCEGIRWSFDLARKVTNKPASYAVLWQRFERGRRVDWRIIHYDPQPPKNEINLAAEVSR